jgi:hypothetical protein
MENTHLKYNTIGHEHLDSVVNWAMGDYPSSGLLLIECEDGRWFIGVDFGDDYNNIDGISKPDIKPYIAPKFFSQEDSAFDFAVIATKKVYPELKDKDFSEYYD